MVRLSGLRVVAISAVAVWCLASIQAAPAPQDSAAKTKPAATERAKSSNKKGSRTTKGPKKPFTVQDRLDTIRRAHVWTATDIPSMDVKVGPKSPEGFAPDARVTCDYVEHSKGSGTTPKFRCKTPDQELKVRYGNLNGEVYAQVAASRLLWVLGFGADRMYPVKVACTGCPYEPFTDTEKPDARQSKVVLFDPATIDIKMDGKTLETKLDEGWAWPELDRIDEKAGGAPLAQRDALKLLAVMIQHTDSKASNQRLLCLDKELAKKDKKSAKKADESAISESATAESAAAADKAVAEAPETKPETKPDAKDAKNDGCAHPFMMLTDMGKTFGHANPANRDENGAVNFKEWSKVPIWKDPGKPGCVGNMPKSISGTLGDPRISEDGRKFLADLLSRLTDAQIHDLFTVARVTRRDPSATVDDWVKAFKHKRDEIANRTCSPST